MRKKIISYGLSVIVLLSIFAMAMPVSAVVQMVDNFGVNNASGDMGTYGGVTVSIKNNFTTAEEVASPADNWAVLIGIADYPGTRNDLNSPDNDVADMYDVLTERSGFAPDHILRLLNESATKANIADAIETWLANNEAADDTVVIYYSGHGSYDTDDNGDEADGIDEFLCPYNTDVYDNTTMIRDDEFDTMLDALDSEKAVIILDSCFSGGMTKATKAIGRSSMPMGSLSERTQAETIEGPMVRSLVDTPKALIIDGFKKDIAQPGRLVLMATDDSETGWSWPILDNGVFTYYLTWGLRSVEADNDSNGLVSFEEAFSYASPRVQTFVAVTIDPLWEETLEQHPQVDDKIDGDVDISIPVAKTWTECIDDGDEGVTPDINKVYFSLNPTDVSFRIEMNENIDLSSFISRTYLDVDQNSLTGYNDPDRTNDIGADFRIYVLVLVVPHEDVGTIGSVFLKPSLWEWKSGTAKFDYVTEIPDTYFDNEYTFSVPLGELNGDEGNMDVVQRVGYMIDYTPSIYYSLTDIAPDTGHGTIGPPPTSGSVSGTITYASNGTGIEGATVKLTQSCAEIDSSTTDASGDYEFTNVSSGDYYVNASKSGFWENATAVTVTEGATTTADMMLMLKGDFNNNGAVDIGDVAKVANMVVGNVQKDLQADFNGNGDVDIGDAAKIANYFVGNIGAL